MAAEVHQSAFSLADVAGERYEPGEEADGPAVLLLHGRDGLVQGGPRYRPLARELAGHGLVVFLVEYFGGPRPAREVTDLTQFLGWARRVETVLAHAAVGPTGRARPVGLVGFSLGGYLAVAVAARDRRVGAVVECSGGLPAPLAGALGRMPPVLILHGEADLIVPVSEAARLRDALEAGGQPCETVLYPGEGHAFSPAIAQDAMRLAVAFLRRRLGAAAQG